MKNNFFQRNKQSILILTIVLLSIFFRFWGINNLDIEHDAALNSVRAFGWFDFLAGKGQTSPIIWFGYIPWWARLSFHDHPPGIFAIQYFFLNIFGQSSLALLFSYAISGVLTTFFIYLLMKKEGRAIVGLIAAFIYSLSSFAVWVSRTGYTESVLNLFIILSLYFFYLFIKSSNYKYWFYFVVFLSLTLLTKYTGIFLIAMACIYLLIFRREVFFNKLFYLCNILFFVILSPVIIYNVMTWKTRGHFDAALSSILGMHPSDYSILLRAVNSNIWTNFTNLLLTLYQNVSLFFLLLMGLSIIWLIYKVIKQRDNNFNSLLLMGILLVLVMLIFGDTSSRFLSMIIPYVSICLAIFIADIMDFLQPRKILKIFLVSLLIIGFAWEFFFSLNTNIFYNPVGPAGWTYSINRFWPNGFNELDKYLRENVYGKLPPKRSISVLDDQIKNYHLVGKEVIVFDDRTHWNSQMWYIHRYQAYYDMPVVFLADVVKANKDDNIFVYLKKNGVSGFWLVIAQENSLVKGDQYYQNADYNKYIDNMVSELENSGIKPIKEIKNDQHNKSFYKIYHFYLNN